MRDDHGPSEIAAWTRPLAVFAMDHRDSFRTLLGLGTGAADRERGRSVKRVVMAGFLAAVADEERSDGRPPDGVTVLVDEEYADHLVDDARAAGALVCLPLERSGQRELSWEYGDDLTDSAGVVDRLRPDLVKILVRYNPADDRELNLRQAARLAQASDWCARRRLPLMLEVLMPPTSSQREASGADLARWDAQMRPTLMVRAVEELRAVGVDPAVWKVEGLDAPADAAAVVAATRTGGRPDVACIVLGRGADLDRVEQWLRVGASTPGFVGFAVGRSLWNGPALAHDRGLITAEQATAEIAANYQRLCATWRSLAPL